MAKRLTDTEKWKMAWFRELSPKLKAINDFICDNCDHAGIWEIDLGGVSFFVNDKNSKGQIQPVTLAEVRESFQNRIVLLGLDKIFLESFVLFQYKLKSLADLKMSNKVHRSIVERLEKYNIIGVQFTPVENSDYPKANITILKGLPMPLVDGAKDKDKNKELDKDQDTEKEKPEPLNFESLYQMYPNKVNKAEGLRRLADQIKTQADFIKIETAIKNYVRYLRLEKNSFQAGKQFDVFIGPKSKDIKPWENWVNPDPSIFADTPTSKIDFKTAKAIEEKERGERQAQASIRRAKEAIGEYETSKATSSGALTHILEKTGKGSLLDAVLSHNKEGNNEPQ